jgi:protoporphyrinogen oxidase
VQTVVIGAGLAGLACAGEAGRQFRVIEAEDRVGGLCRTEKYRGFTVDLTGHYLHFRDAEVRKKVFLALKGNIEGIPRDSWVLVGGRMTPYPFQANLYSHDPATIRECLAGLVRARAHKGGKAPKNYHEWILRTFGAGFARHFLFPFNTKQFKVPLTRLTSLQAGRFVPRPSLEEVVRGAMVPGGGNGIGYNAMMWHPRRGGIESLPKALARGLASRVETGVRVVRLDLKTREAVLADGRRLPWGVLVSTMPLPAVLGMLNPRPRNAGRLGKALKSIGVLCVNVLVRNPVERKRHWIYVPGKEASFYRVGFPSNINHADAPRGCGIISAEVSYLPGRRPAPGPAVRRVETDIVRMGLVARRGDIIRSMAADLPVSYVLFDHNYSAARSESLALLARHNILSIGRYGSWVYGGMEDAIREGIDTGRLVRAYGERAGSRFRAGRA